MQKAILVGALLLIGGSAMALPTTNQILATGVGPLTEDIIISVLGYRPETMTMVTFTDKGQITKEVPFEEIVANLEQTSLGNAQDGPVPASRCAVGGGLGIYCGPDAGAGSVGAPPFCDNSSAWIAHSGSPGDTYSILSGPTPTGIVTCGGFYGPTYNWDEVEMDALSNAANIAYEGCYAVTWTIHSNAYCPNPFTAQDTFVWHWRASGTGVAAAFGAPGGAFDYFLGNGAANGYDLPAGVVGP